MPRTRSQSSKNHGNRNTLANKSSAGVSATTSKRTINQRETRKRNVDGQIKRRDGREDNSKKLLIDRKKEKPPKKDERIKRESIAEGVNKKQKKIDAVRKNLKRKQPRNSSHVIIRHKNEAHLTNDFRKLSTSPSTCAVNNARHMSVTQAPRRRDAECSKDDHTYCASPDRMSEDEFKGHRTPRSKCSSKRSKLHGKRSSETKSVSRKSNQRNNTSNRSKSSKLKKSDARQRELSSEDDEECQSPVKRQKIIVKETEKQSRRDVGEDDFTNIFRKNGKSVQAKGTAKGASPKGGKKGRKSTSQRAGELKRTRTVRIDDADSEVRIDEEHAEFDDKLMHDLSSQETLKVKEPTEEKKMKCGKFDIDLSSCGSLYKKQLSQTPTRWLSQGRGQSGLEKIAEIQFPGLSDLWIEGVAFKPDGKLVVASGYNLYVCDLDSKLQTLLGTEECGFLEGPGDVTLLSCGDIAVSDSLANDVKIYSSTTGRYIKSIAGDTSATGIAQNRRGEIIIVDNLHDSQDLCSVLIYSQDGDLLRTIENDEDAKYFDFPMYVTTNSRDDIIVSDCIGRHISTFDSNGNFLFKCTGYNDSEKQTEMRFYYPCGVCTDSEDGVLLVDRYGHCVHRMTQHGQYDRLVLTSSDGLVDPRSIALDRKSKTLAVGDENGKVMLFKYDMVDNV